MGIRTKKVNKPSELLQLSKKHYGDGNYLQAKDYFLQYVYQTPIKLTSSFLEYTLDMLLKLNEIQEHQNIVQICTHLWEHTPHKSKLEGWEIALKSSLAIAYKNMGVYEKAHSIFDQLLKKYSDHPNLYYLSGTVYEAEDDLLSALKSYKRSLEVDPECLDALHGLRVVYQQEGNISELERVCNRILQVSPDDLEALNSLAISSIEQDDLEKAIRILTQIIEKDNYFIAAWFNIGIAYKESGKFRKAIEALNIVLEFEPDNLDALNILAKTYLDGEKYERAIDTFRQLLEMDKKRFFYFLGCAYSYIHISELTEALRFLKKALKLNPDSEEARFLKKEIEKHLE